MMTSYIGEYSKKIVEATVVKDTITHNTTVQEDRNVRQ